MKLDIILQLLFANDMKDIVARAVQIENGIALPYGVGSKMLVECSKSELPEGYKFKGDNSSWGWVLLEVIAVNIFSLTTPYLVILPNGTNKWTKEPGNRTTATEIAYPEPVGEAVSMAH